MERLQFQTHFLICSLMKARHLIISLTALAATASAQASVRINATTFPDANFRNAILEEDYGADGLLTDAEIASIKVLDVEELEIQSLKGIEYFTALTRLNCRFNELTSLDVSRNTALKSLNCSDNELTSLDVSRNTALTTLNCNSNKLTSLDVSRNTALTELKCLSNKLTSLDLSRNTALETLYCHYNQLTTLDLSRNTELKSLVCSDNKLTTLNVSNNPKLNFILIVGNKMWGAGMDAFVRSLPTTTGGRIHVMTTQEGEQNVMTQAQMAAAKAKGWTPKYLNPDTNNWEEL